MRKLVLLCLIAIISVQSFAQPAKIADSVQIRQTINSFYSWYTRNMQKVAAFKLYSISKKTSQFKINWNEVERYLAWLKKSAPQLGEEFARNERLFFKECDSVFKTQVQDEVPYGFDGDRFTNSQEPEYTIEEMKKARQWDTKMEGDHATVEVLSSYTDKGKEVETLVICFQMKKEKSKWTIAKIGCTFVPPTEEKSK